MTRRERLERKAERLHGWAAKRETAAAAVFKAGEVYHGDTAFNTQPGHIPERARLIAREDRAYASHKKAQGMESRAAGIEHALDRSIYSDDPDALESLAARIAELEASRDRMKRINAEIRKGDGWLDRLAASGCPITDHEGKHLVDAARFSGSKGYPAYALTNIGGNIRRLKERAEEIKRRNEQATKAENAGGVLIDDSPGCDWARVTFAEKPDRAVLDALRAAGWQWGNGSWHGARSTLPACVRELAEQADEQLPENPTTDGSIAVAEVLP